MNEISFNGALAERFGPSVKMEVETPREAIRALCFQVEGFREYMMEGSYTLIRGDKETGFVLGLDTMDLGLGDQPLHIYPAVTGEGGDNGGLIKAIIGAALIVGSFYIAGPSGVEGMATVLGVETTVATAANITYAVASAGVSLTLSGVATMLAPGPRGLDPNDGEDKQTSFIFNGPVNVAEQGHPVPLVVGHIRTGSVVISSGIENEQMRTLPFNGFFGNKAQDPGFYGPSAGGVGGFGSEYDGWYVDNFVPSDDGFSDLDTLVV